MGADIPAPNNRTEDETMPARKPYADTLRVETVADWDADASYLEQDEWTERHAAYMRGDFGYIGVRVTATLHIPHGAGWILQTITTPGLWGIEDDSGDQYLAEVAADETDVLRSMLAELGATLKAES